MLVYLIILHFLRDFGISNGIESTIATKSIEEVRYRGMIHVSGSKIVIIYTNRTGTDEEVRRRQY